MNAFAVLLIAAATFCVCYLFDKGYTAKFRNKVQHRSGLSVRLSKRYAAFGLILSVIGLTAVFTGLTNGPVLLIGGIIVMLMGIGLIVYYMTFGVFYDADSFIVTTFGKKSRTYNFRDIRSQQLYVVQGGNIIIELHLSDKSAVSLQSVMEGVYPFLDHAFAAWCRQTGRDPESCTFHDPSNSLWFPSEEEI
jgi:hypothetical protein